MEEFVNWSNDKVQWNALIRSLEIDGIIKPEEKGGDEFYEGITIAEPFAETMQNVARECADQLFPGANEIPDILSSTNETALITYFTFCVLRYLPKISKHKLSYYVQYLVQYAKKHTEINSNRGP